MIKIRHSALTACNHCSWEGYLHGFPMYYSEIRKKAVFAGCSACGRMALRPKTIKVQHAPVH